MPNMTSQMSHHGKFKKKRSVRLGCGFKYALFDRINSVQRYLKYTLLIDLCFVVFEVDDTIAYTS